MSARKKNANRYSNYIFSLRKNNIEDTSKYCIGNLKSNFSSSKYLLNGVDEGCNAKTTSAKKLAYELACISYVK